MPLQNHPDLGALCNSLAKERTRTVQEVACGSRYSELCHDEKALVSSMSKELVQFEHYLHALKDAAYLNKFITLVQTFTQRKMRELYLELCGVVGAAYCNCLEDFLFHLKAVYLLHDQLSGYLTCQSYRSWAVGTARNATHKYKPLFRYQFPACDFNRPLVIRNPDLWVDNAAKMFYVLVDLFTKFKCTKAYALSCTELLWLGKSIASGHGVLASSYSAKHAHSQSPNPQGDRLWLKCVDANDANRSPCPEYNAVWFPQFHFYVQFTCAQTLCKGDLFIDWAHTSNCTDPQRQQALVERCAACCSDGTQVTYELYFRPTVDWNLFCPFKVHLNYTQHDGCACPADNVAAHTDTGSFVIEVDRVREDYLLVLCKDTPIRAGTYVGTEFKTCNVQPEFWRKPLDQLVQFYKCVLDTEDMQLMQNEAQTKQLHNVVSCIQKNIAMYHDVIGDFVHVDNVLALNKIRKLTELIHTVEKLLVREPLTVVATSHDKGKKTTQVIREKTRVGYEDTCDADDYHVRNGRVQDNVADYDSDISRFSDDEGAWVG